MDHRDLRLDLTTTPSSDVEMLIRRIRDLQKERDAATRGKANFFLILRDAEKKLRSLLKELDIDEVVLPITGSEDVSSLVDTLAVAVKALCHEIDCRGRDQRRLYKVIEESQSRFRQLARDGKAFERSNTELEMRVDALEDEVKRAKRRKHE